MTAFCKALATGFVWACVAFCLRSNPRFMESIYPEFGGLALMVMLFSVTAVIWRGCQDRDDRGG